jgi:DNA-binding transcriptional ArsR family regulator
VVVVYPMAHDTAVGRPSHLRPSLGALLGRTRTEVPESLAEHHAMTTTELTHCVGIAPATASHHAGVLREAGLLNTSRAGQAVLHTLTRLGLALLPGRPPSAPRAFDRRRRVFLPPQGSWEPDGMLTALREHTLRLSVLALAPSRSS